MIARRFLFLVFSLFSLSSTGIVCAQQQKTLTVTVKVTDPSSAGIPNATIRVFPAPHPRPPTMQTDANGELALQLDPGGHTFFVSASGFAGDTRHIEIEPGRAEQLVPVMLRIPSYSGPVVVVTDEQAAEYASRLHVSAMPFQEEWSISPQGFSKLPHTSVKIIAPSTGKKQRYSGVRLSDLLERAGVPIGEEWDDITLGRYLQVLGTSSRFGQTSVLFSLAELRPGLHAGEILIADMMNEQPIGELHGPFVLVVSTDKNRVRWLERVQRLDLQLSGR